MLKMKLFIPLLLIVAGIVALILIAEESSADTITVAKSGGDFTSIQDAIDNATEGDTITVWEGTYYENVVVNKKVNLVGNGSEVTTIDAGGSGDPVQILEDWVKMSGFNVTGSGDEWSVGIWVEANHISIFENTCSNNNYGIDLYYSRDCTITDNTCSNNSVTAIARGLFSTINNNTCSNNGGAGISGGSFNTITNNTCSNNVNGFFLYGVSNLTLTNNTCNSNNNHGIELSSSNNCTITNNTMNDNGIYISGSLGNWDTHTIETTNTVNANPVYYYNNDEGFTAPLGAGQVILANCSGITVEKQNCSNGSVGILVGYSSNITLENNTCSNNRYGISISTSSDCTITNNTCSSNTYYDNDYGIALTSSTDVLPPTSVAAIFTLEI